VSKCAFTFETFCRELAFHASSELYDTRFRDVKINFSVHVQGKERCIALSAITFCAPALAHAYKIFSYLYFYRERLFRFIYTNEIERSRTVRSRLMEEMLTKKYLRDPED
jgi:hypothetical protein